MVEVFSRDKPRVRQRRRPFGRWFRETGWRHIVGVLALLFALFPVWFVVIAAFSESASLSNQTLWPESFTLRQFRALLDNYPFWRWFFNSLIISFVTSTATVLLAASAAFAFSRLRFRGRRGGLARSAADPDVPGVAGVRGDLPDGPAAGGLRRVSAPGRWRRSCSSTSAARSGPTPG